jgi:hypothetical protein
VIDAARASVARAFALCFILTLAACGHSHKDERPPYPVMSPNGEPLSGGPLGPVNCKDALAGWFERVNAAHDGRLTLAEYLGDARRQFAAMDLDKDGMITPAVLARYRAPYMPKDAGERRVAAAPPPRSPNDARPGTPPPHAFGTPRGNAAASSDPTADRPDPVMAADVHLRNEVSLADFLAHAQRRFTALDVDRRGTLSREDLQRLCPSER